MTMMNSDSESQDSDEGRRFRFEATRKDSTSQNNKNSNSNSNNKSNSNSTNHTNSSHHRNSPARSHPQRSRSHDRDRPRFDRDRSNYDRSHRTDTYNPRDDRRKRRMHDDRYRNDLRHRSGYRDTWDMGKRDSRSRDSRSRDDKHHRLRDRFYERHYDDDYSRNRNGQSKEREKIYKKHKTHDNNDDKSHLDIDENRLDDDSISIEAQDCKDLNLSDFDIVSDTEETKNSPTSRRKSLENRSNCRLRRENQQSSADNSDRFTLDDASDTEDTFSPQAIASASTSSRIPVNFDTNADEMANSADFERSNDDFIDRRCADDDNNDNDDNLNDNLTSDDDADGCYGPILPPKLSKSVSISADDKKIIGPCLPSNIREVVQENDGSDDEDADVFGPTLPPIGKSARIIGPVIPERLRANLKVNAEGAGDDNNVKKIGNNGTDDEHDDDDIFGPLPADDPSIDSDRIQQQLEYRAKLIKKELAKIDFGEEKKREEWMTELPSVQTVNLGLGPRKFRSREGPDMSDRSSWTDTPADRERKQKDLLMGIGKSNDDDHDDEYHRKIYTSKHEEESLLDLHQKKLRKKKKKEEKKAKKDGRTIERRPFNRDIDMQVNRFDDARKKSIIMKAQGLDDRFSRGKI